MKCVWCRDLEIDDPAEGTLCRSHEAEYQGLSEAELDRKESEERKDLL